MSRNENNKSRMAAIVGMFTVVIAAVAYFGVKYPIPGDQASGTIAPAERYRGEQISSDDIVLGDESVARVMQTDVYQRIISDAGFAEALSNEAFRESLNNEAFRLALSNEAFRLAERFVVE